MFFVHSSSVHFFILKEKSINNIFLEKKTEDDTSPEK